MTRRHYLILSLMLAVLVVPFFAKAQYLEEELKRVYLDEPTIIKGYTVKTEDESFLVGIRPFVFNEPGSIKLSRISQDQFDTGERKIISDKFLYNIPMSSPKVLEKPIIVAIKYSSDSEYKKNIHFFDRNKNDWVEIPTTIDKEKKLARAFIHFPFSILTVFEQEGVNEYNAPRKVNNEALYLEAHAGAIIDAKSGELLFEKNGNQAITMASLTKVMTALVVLEEGTDLNKITTVQGFDMAEGAALPIYPGDQIIVKDLFFASLVKSANNATKALAHSTGLPENVFVSKMNDLAGKLGLTTMHFDGVTGLESGNKTSAVDFAKLSNYAYKNFLMLQGSTTKNYCLTIQNSGRHVCFSSTNRLLDSSLYITGGKTGYLPGVAGGAGSSLMIKAKNDEGHEVIAVVLAHPNYQRQFYEVENMINWAFRNYKWE